MKICVKTYLLLISFFLLSFQTIKGQNFRLGFQASPQLSWMHSSVQGVEHLKANPGIDYGLVADFYLFGLPRYSFNTGILISNQSFKTKIAAEQPFELGAATFTQPVDFTFRLNYLQVPTIIKLKTDPFYRSTFYGQFGVASFFNLSANASSSDGKLSGQNVSDAFRLYSIALTMGAGVEYDLGRNTALVAGINYSRMFSDATSYKNLTDKSEIHSVKLVLGIMF